MAVFGMSEEERKKISEQHKELEKKDKEILNLKNYIIKD